MSNEWQDEKLSELKLSAEMLESLWKKMGELSKKTPADISLDDLKKEAINLCKDILKDTVNPTNLVNMLINVSDIDEASKAKAQQALDEIDTIIAETKSLAEKAEIAATILENTGFQLDIAKSAGEFSAIGQTLINIGKNALESTASHYIEKALNKLGASSEEIQKAADAMKTIVEGDPEGIIVDQLKEKLNEKFAEAIGPTNSVAGEIAKACACDALEQALEGDFDILNNVVETGVSKLKEFKGKGTTLDDAIIDVIDTSYETVKNGGSLHAVANNILDVAKDYAVTEGKAKLQEKLDEMCGSSEEMKSVADALMRMTEEDPREVAIDFLKEKITEKFSEAAQQSNSITMTVAHVAISGVAEGGVEAGINAGINAGFDALLDVVKKNSEKAVSEIKSISEKADVSKEAVDSFDLQQGVAQGAGELLAHADEIEELINKVKTSAKDPSLLENIADMESAYNDLIARADNMIASTKEDPCKVSLENMKAEVKQVSEDSAGSIEQIADAAGKAIASGLLDSATMSLFDKIKEKASEAKKSQEKVSSSADNAGTGSTSSDNSNVSDKSDASDKTDTSEENDSSDKSGAADAGDNAAQDQTQQDDASLETENTETKDTAEEGAPQEDAPRENTRQENAAEESDKGDSTPSEETKQEASQPDTSEQKSDIEELDSKVPDSEELDKNKTNEDITPETSSEDKATDNENDSEESKISSAKEDLEGIKDQKDSNVDNKPDLGSELDDKLSSDMQTDIADSKKSESKLDGLSDIGNEPEIGKESILKNSASNSSSIEDSLNSKDISSKQDGLKNFDKSKDDLSNDLFEDNFKSGSEPSSAIKDANDLGKKSDSGDILSDIDNKFD